MSGFWEKFEYVTWRVLGHWFGTYEQYVKEQNPCTHKAVEWQAEDPESRGYIWYYVRGIRKIKYYHAVGYMIKDGEEQYVDCVNGNAIISLTEKELETVIFRLPPQSQSFTRMLI